MPDLTVMTAPALLVELDSLGGQASIKAGQISLRPASQLTDELLERARGAATDLMLLLADPRCRWREQAVVLVAGRPDGDHEELLHVFDEREAIASFDGGQEADRAGELAYETLKDHLRELAP